MIEGIIWQKKVVNALKSEVEKLKYANLKSVSIKSDCWNSGYNTYIDLGRSHNLTINEKEVPNELIEKLYSKHKDLILEDENGRKNYSPFLKQIFIKILGMFKKVCQAAFLVQLNFQSVGKEDVKLRHS